VYTEERIVVLNYAVNCWDYTVTVVDE